MDIYGELYQCWGANRSANSYTSGKWTDYVIFFTWSATVGNSVVYSFVYAGTPQSSMRYNIKMKYA